jgi:Tfp pilus assembly protein PilE
MNIKNNQYGFTLIELMIFLPLVGKRKDATIAINRHTGAISGTFDVDPWIS